LCQCCISGFLSFVCCLAGCIVPLTFTSPFQSRLRSFGTRPGIYSFRGKCYVSKSTPTARCFILASAFPIQSNAIITRFALPFAILAIWSPLVALDFSYFAWPVEEVLFSLGVCWKEEGSYCREKAVSSSMENIIVETKF
jgi:hypothetical protein